MKLLFIGRFQPFHKNHLRIIEKILKLNADVIVCIAGAQYSHTKRNPFTYCERGRMMELAFEQNNIETKNIRIVPLPDINDPENWVDYVTKVVGGFDIVITNNPETEKLFKNKGYLTMKIPIDDKYGVCGTSIREEMARHTNLWELEIPRSVIEYIKEIEGDKRVREIYGRLGN